MCVCSGVYHLLDRAHQLTDEKTSVVLAGYCYVSSKRETRSVCLPCLLRLQFISAAPSGRSNDARQPHGGGTPVRARAKMFSSPRAQFFLRCRGFGPRECVRCVFEFVQQTFTGTHDAQPVTFTLSAAASMASVEHLASFPRMLSPVFAPHSPPLRPQAYFSPFWSLQCLRMHES